MNRKQVSDFEKIQAQLQSLYGEVGALSKKKPDDAINKFKLKLVNDVLRGCADLLGESHQPIADFTTFSDEDLPTNSDVLMVISLYLNALEKFRADNITEDFATWYWLINGRQSDIQTGPPRKLKY
jgi:hypothetical protein